MFCASLMYFFSCLAKSAGKGMAFVGVSVVYFKDNNSIFTEILGLQLHLHNAGLRGCNCRLLLL